MLAIRFVMNIEGAEFYALQGMSAVRLVAHGLDLVSPRDDPRPDVCGHVFGIRLSGDPRV
jgi:hypothetical protein